MKNDVVIMVGTKFLRDGDSLTEEYPEARKFTPSSAYCVLRSHLRSLVPGDTVAIRYYGLDKERVIHSLEPDWSIKEY